MSAARTFLERITSQAIVPMVTLGVSGAIAVTLMELFETFRAQLASAPQPR